MLYCQCLSGAAHSKRVSEASIKDVWPSDVVRPSSEAESRVYNPILDTSGQFNSVLIKAVLLVTNCAYSNFGIILTRFIYIWFRLKLNYLHQKLHNPRLQGVELRLFCCHQRAINCLVAS